MVSTPLKNIAQNGFIFPNCTGEHIFELPPPRYTQQNNGNNFKLFFSGRLTPWFAWRSFSFILGVIQVGNYHTYRSSSNGIRLPIPGQNFGTAKKNVHKIEPDSFKNDVCIYFCLKDLFIHGATSVLHKCGKLWNSLGSVLDQETCPDFMDCEGEFVFKQGGRTQATMLRFHCISCHIVPNYCWWKKSS